MPIPFRDADDLDDLGVASYLRIERAPDGATYLGALFTINARGEPIELTYNALETPRPFLWRPADLRRHAERRLTASLLAISEVLPRLILCEAGAVGLDLFTRDLEVDVPVARVERPSGADARQGDGPDPGAAGSIVPDAIQVSWHPTAPADGTVERALFDELSGRGLLLEPFDRAADGLREVYGARQPDA